MTKYEFILFWSEEDGAFLADVPELPVCMSHGDTQSQALENAQEAAFQSIRQPESNLPRLG